MPFARDAAGEHAGVARQLGQEQRGAQPAVAAPAVTGEDRMDATAMLAYFAPLKAWLDAQNQQLAVTDKSLK